MGKGDCTSVCAMALQLVVTTRSAAQRVDAQAITPQHSTYLVGADWPVSDSVKGQLQSLDQHLMSLELRKKRLPKGVPMVPK